MQGVGETGCSEVGCVVVSCEMLCWGLSALVERAACCLEEVLSFCPLPTKTTPVPPSNSRSPSSSYTPNPPKPHNPPSHLSLPHMHPKFAFSAFMRAINRGQKVAEAAAIVGVGVSTAYRWQASGAPRTPGRKPNHAARLAKGKALGKIAGLTKTVGVRRVPLYPTAPRIARRYLEETGISMHATTCIRLLALAGKRSFVRPRHPNLQNRDARYHFARRWFRRPAQRVVFSDEHYISTNDNTNRRMYASSRDEVLPRERQRRQNIPNFQIWAAVGVGFKSDLIFFPKYNPEDDAGKKGGYRLTAVRYVRRCLSRVAEYLATHDVVFMQDGARAHTARSTLAYLERKGIEVMEGYPSHSPDLNPIESIWALLDRMIAERLTEQTDEALVAAAKSAWAEMDQGVIDAHVLSFKSKCAALVRSGGL